MEQAIRRGKTEAPARGIANEDAVCEVQRGPAEKPGHEPIGGPGIDFGRRTDLNQTPSVEYRQPPPQRQRLDRVMGNEDYCRLEGPAQQVQMPSELDFSGRI